LPLWQKREGGGKWGSQAGEKLERKSSKRVSGSSRKENGGNGDEDQRKKSIFEKKGGETINEKDFI